MERSTLWLCAIILFGAFVLRLWNLGTQSLWHDEAWSVMSAYQPLYPIDPNYPPLFTVLLGVWVQLAGDSVWAMRFWSLLFSVATVAVITVITRRRYGDRAAIIAAILGAASPILWVFSQEIRSYVLIPILVTVLLALVDALLRDPNSRRVWIWLALVEIIMLYTHNLAVPVVAWLNVTVGVVWVWRREWYRLRTWILVQIGLFILYLPWLLTQSPTGTPLNTPPVVNATLLWNIWQSYFTGIKALVGADTQLMALTAAFGLVALGSIVGALLYRRSAWTWLVLSQVLLVPVFEAIIVLVAHIDFHPRYFLAGVPAMLILIAAGLDTLVRRRWLSGLALVSTLVLAVGIMIRMVTVVYSSPVYQHDDFRGIAEHYAALGPNDAIIIPYGWEPTLDYFSRKMNFKAKMVGIPLHSSADTIMAQLQTALKGVNRAEVLTWYQLPADVRGAYSCLLGKDRQPQSTLTLSGLQTTSYGEPGPASPETIVVPLKLDFGPIKLTNVRTEIGSAGACVITQWQLTQMSGDDWQLAVRAQNYLGWELTRADGELINDVQLPASMWKTEGTGTAFSFLKLPEGSPVTVFITVDPGSTVYPVVATVYSSKNPSGLAVLEDGKPESRDPVIVATIENLATFSTPVQPSAADMDLDDGIYLHRKIISADTLQPGQDVRITLEWWQTTLDPKISQAKPYLSLEGTGWQTESNLKLIPQSKLLTWSQLRVPAAASGHAVLKVTAPDGKTATLAEYDITPINRTFTEPPITNRVSADFVGVGSLLGVDVPQTINHGEAPKIQLTWQASASPDVAYTVFVHLLDANGQVVAQSDSQPAEGSRPITSWVQGEYITDLHTLTWNRPDYTGPARVEIGLYDQNTGERVKLADSTDHFVLASTVMVR